MPKSKTYEEFVAKFEPKKTTDDCYTPPLVYDAVADWVASKYGLDKQNFVRPFYPGGDYQNFEYKETDIVVDNPPFSIFSEIKNFYMENGIKFFLFAPFKTLFNYLRHQDVYCITTKCKVTYTNGAQVPTSFITNLEKDYILGTEPALAIAVNKANKDSLNRLTLPKYEYPKNLLTATVVSNLETEFKVKKGEAVFTRQLDAQKPYKKAIYGAGLLISDEKAEQLKAEQLKAEQLKAEQLKAEQLKAEQPKYIWELSEREQEIVRNLGGCQNGI